MAHSSASRPASVSGSSWTEYWSAARRPLEILALLLPLVVAYELCLVLVLRSEGGVTTVEAHRRLVEFFSVFGISPVVELYLGGLLIVVVLLVWHVLTRNRWRMDGSVVGLMAIESLLLAGPLLVLRLVLSADPVAAAVSAPGAFGELDLWSQMAISIGAGLYEELIFRMVLIAVVHTLLVDVARAPAWLGATIAILLSAAAFAWYHGRDLVDPGGALSPRRVLFYSAAGIYFGVVFTLRGFGVVVGAHALYDILVVLMPEGEGLRD